jgi:hypothetical protein
MILDGAVAPDADPIQQDIGAYQGFQQAFEDFAAWCAQQDTCALGTNPDTATATYQAMVRPLLDKPLPLADGRVLAFGDATIGTIDALYSDSSWQDLSGALSDLSNGKGDALMGLADSYDGRDAKGQYSNFLDVLTAVHCMDDPRTTDPATLAAAAAKLAAAAPFIDTGDPPTALKSLCDFWPAEPTLTPHMPDVTGLPQVLVISTTGDPATPYQAGVELAKALGARLLTVEGTRHGAYLGVGLSCVDDIGTTYLVTLALPDADTTCG